MVTNRVYKVLVSNGTEATSLASASTGNYLVLKPDGSKFTSSDVTTAQTEFKVGVKAPDNSWIFSDIIKVGDVTSLQDQAFRARVEQVKTVTIATPVVGQEYTLSILDLSDKEILQMRQAKRSYSVVASADTTTAANVAAAFAAKINKDYASVVSATSSGASLVLTAKSSESNANIIGEYPNQVIFDVFLSSTNPDYYLQGFGSVAQTTAPDLGSGNFDQIRRLEQEGQGYMGVTNRTLFPVDPGSYASAVGTSYDVIVLEAEKTASSNSATFGLVKAPISLIIAVTAGQSATLLALISSVVNSTGHAA